MLSRASNTTVNSEEVLARIEHGRLPAVLVAAHEHVLGTDRQGDDVAVLCSGNRSGPCRCRPRCCPRTPAAGSTSSLPAGLRHPRDDRQEGHREAQGGEGGERLAAGVRGRMDGRRADSADPPVSSSSRASRVNCSASACRRLNFWRRSSANCSRRGLPVAVLEDQRRGGVQYIGLLALGVEHGQPIAHRFGGKARDSLRKVHSFISLCE